MSEAGKIADALARAKEEERFRQWYDRVASKLGIATDPDDPEHYYDYRAFHREVEAGRAKSPDAGGHFPSAFKTEGHPRAFLQDSKGRLFDTRTGEYVAGGRVPERELVASEASPDVPGMDAEKAKRLRDLAMALGAGR